MSVVAEAGEGHWITCLTCKNFGSFRTCSLFWVACLYTDPNNTSESVVHPGCQMPCHLGATSTLSSRSTRNQGKESESQVVVRVQYTPQSFSETNCHETENLLRRTQAKSCGWVKAAKAGVGSNEILSFWSAIREAQSQELWSHRWKILKNWKMMIRLSLNRAFICFPIFTWTATKTWSKYLLHEMWESASTSWTLHNCQQGAVRRVLSHLSARCNST